MMKINASSVEELVTERLRWLILTGHLPLGKHLQQGELAEQLGVSRVPLRAAFRTLEAERLIRFEPHKGAVITVLSRDDLIDIYDTRVLLECQAAKLAIPKLTPEALASMRETLDAMQNETNPRQRIELNRTFHHTLYEAAQRPHLLSLITMLRNQVEPYLQTYNSRDPEVRAQVQEEHRQILVACEQGDIELTQVYTKRHLEHVLANLLARMPHGEESV
jgi:DNA-binding GntR family transcriptional regulator